MTEQSQPVQSKPEHTKPELEDDLPEQMRIRREKRSRLIAAGAEPYPVAVPRTTTLKALRERFADLEIDVATGQSTQLQVMFSLDRAGEEVLAAWKSDVDLGDLVSVTGEVITSKRGELSVLASSWMHAAKALRPLPVEHKPLSEETRVRMRYVDLIMRDTARDVARLRPKVMRSLRESFHERTFIEVETPMLQVLHGGATARPFV
ncbi:MAG: lysine--tRNA ligase, partial [Actinobacteria bacterium]|nr:lysine--tRNA ligase [Actinomycetota bacterium]